MDDRRAQWFAFDANFFGGSVGVAIKDEFGADGIVVFLAFLAACKRSSVEGQISFLNDADAHAILGIQGIPLVRPDGSTFMLNDVWLLLARFKQASKTQRGLLTYVRSTRWERWQNVRGTAATRAGNHRRTTVGPPSDHRRTTVTPPQKPRSVPTKTAPDTDKDKDKTNTRDAYPEPFEHWWAEYPRKANKAGAFKMWERQTNAGVGPEELLIAAKHYRVTTRGTEDRFVMHGSTFLGPDRRWRDHLKPPRLRAVGDELYADGPDEYR